MVTLGSIQPATFQAFHGSAPYDNTLNFQSFELALNDVSDVDVPPSTSEPAEEIAPLEPAKPARRSSLVVPPLANRSGPDEAHISPARPAYTQSSASHRLFRPAEPELKSWHAHLPTDEGTGIIGLEPSAASKIESRSRASSWHASDMGRRRSPLRAFSQKRKDEAISLSSTSPACTGRRGREDRPTNEILDGSDVLQQISNLTSTEPSNEREVFVGGLRESEDAVHITEEELATYFAKFGVIESVSINRDDRTQRGRGFAFVKFFQEAAALNAVVADASTHVIRGTTVSVQWSRGAKDAGGDRPRRRNSATSATSSNNGCSPSRGSNRSSPKMNMFSHKNGGHRGSGGGGGGGGSCGAGCNHGYSPMRSRSQGHIHASSGAGGGVPYSFCNGGRHGSDHHNQQMVCVVVPAQRAAALGLSQHTTGHLPTGSCSSRGSPPRDSHFAPFIQSSAHGAGGHSGYSSHTRSHSSAATLSSSSGHVGVGGGGSGGGGGGGGGGYGHRASQGGGEQHHAMTAPHHVSPKAGRSYGAPPPMQMPPVHHERRGRPEPRGYPSAASGGGSGGGSGTSPFSDYERTKYESPSHHSTSYTSSDWGGDSVAGRRGMAHGMMRSQSPPDAAPSAMSSMSNRNGGGAPRPPPTPPRGYENQYTSTRYAAAGPAGQIGRATDGFPPGISMTGRRHSGSSVMSGRNTMRQDAMAAMNCYYSVDDMNEYGFDAEYTSTSATASSRLA